MAASYVPDVFTVRLVDGPCDGQTFHLNHPTATLCVPAVKNQTEIPQGILAGYLGFSGKHMYRLRQPIQRQPRHELIYEFEYTEGVRMWCGYCHGSHDNFDEIMRCRHEAEVLETSEEFWTPETVVGYRGFRVVYEKGLPELKGVKMIWETADPGPAKCEPFENTGMSHDAPKVACMCGYYAFKDYKDTHIWAVDGKVEMWGNIIEHESGYRSERVRLVGIRAGRAQPYIMDSTLRQLAERYGVDYGGDW